MLLEQLFAIRTRFELATSCVTGRRSNQLNYRTNFNMLSYLRYPIDSNSRPSPTRLSGTGVPPKGCRWHNQLNYRTISIKFSIDLKIKSLSIRSQHRRR